MAGRFFWGLELLRPPFSLTRKRGQIGTCKTHENLLVHSFSSVAKLSLQDKNQAPFQA